MARSEKDETPYRLADGLFPVRVEPGKSLLIGRVGSPLLIELRVQEKQGMNALIVYDPSGAKPSGAAVAHALEPLGSMAEDAFDAPADAPPGAWAFRWGSRPSVAHPANSKGSASPPQVSPETARDGLEEWFGQERLEAMLWNGIEDARSEGKLDRDLIMAVFDGGTRPGFAVLKHTLGENAATAADAESRARSTVAQAENAGGRLVFQIVATPAAVREALESAGIGEPTGRALDEALVTLPGAPDGELRVALFEEDEVKLRLVPIRSPGERAENARAEEQDAILQAALDKVGEEVRTLHAERRKMGNAAHNLAILVEELEGGKLAPRVLMRSDVARVIDERVGPKAKEIVKALQKSAPAGMTHAVFQVRRAEKMVLIHRLTVVQDVGRN